MFYMVTLVGLMLSLLAACGAPTGDAAGAEATPGLCDHRVDVRTGAVSASQVPSECGSIAPLPETKEPVRVIQATGIGHPPPWLKGARARLMARRAAEVLAVRNLSRKLGCRRRTTLSGFRYVSTDYLPNGAVRVTVEYPRTIPWPRPEREPTLNRSQSEKTGSEPLLEVD